MGQMYTRASWYAVADVAALTCKSSCHVLDGGMLPFLSQLVQLGTPSPSCLFALHLQLWGLRRFRIPLRDNFQQLANASEQFDYQENGIR